MKMKSTHAIRLVSSFILASIAISTGSSSLASSIPKSWTAQEAVIFALENSPDSRIAALRIESALAQRDMADSRFKPQLKLSAGYDQTNNPMFSFGNILNQSSFDETIDFNNPGRTDNLNLKAELLYRFYNGGRDEAAIASAEHEQRAQEILKTAIFHRLGYEVVRAFQMIVQAHDQVEARLAEREAIEASLQVAVARYEAGDLLKAEMLDFEVQRARAIENLILSEHQLERSKKLFLNLLGIEQGNAEIEKSAFSKQELPDIRSYLQRPEINAVQAEVDKAEAELQKSNGLRYPTLDGFALYQYDYGFVNDDGGDSWAAGLKLNYNLYNGNSTQAEIAVKKAHYQRKKEELTKMKLAADLELHEAELSYNQALERQGVTQKMVEVANESAQLSRERFKQGLILSSNLIDVERRLTDALVRQSAARANYQIAIANLRRAAGMQQFTATTEELLEK